MKTFLLPALLAMACFSACAQQNALDRFYEKYKSSDALSGELSLSPSLWLSTSFPDKAGNNWKDKVSHMRLLILDGKKTPALLDDADGLSRRLKDDKFDDLLDVHKGKQSLRLMGLEVNGEFTNLVLLMRGDDDGLVFAELEGRFTDKDMDHIRGSLE